MKRVLSVAPTRHLLALVGFAFAASVGSLSAADHYYVNDHLATTTAVTDAAGEIAAIEADAFGTPVAGATQAARFTGKPYDDDIGAFVFPFRNYRSDEARWMSADPSGFPDGVNGNVYNCGPFTEIDPLGLVSQYTQTTQRFDYVANGPLASYLPYHSSFNSQFSFDKKGDANTGYYTTMKSTQTYSVSGAFQLAKLGSSQGQNVTQAVINQVVIHEKMHEANFKAFVTSVITVVESWINGYSSNLFNSESEAESAIKADLNAADRVITQFEANFNAENDGNGHPEYKYNNGQFVIPDPTSWGATSNANIAAFNPSSSLKKTPGTFHKE